jgi:putative nucleotidyltransferase with HDIG domain
MTGTALHRASLHEETVHRLSRLESLRVVDRAVAGSLDKRVTLNILLNQVISQLEVDAADVLLLNAPLQTLQFTAGQGFHTGLHKSASVRVGESFAGRAVLERRMVRVTDRETARENQDFFAFWVNEEFADYYAVPLIAKGQVKGVIEVFRRKPFTPDSEWLNFLETLAHQAAIALDNAQLFENLQSANMDLTLAYDATIEGWSRAMDLRDEETEGHTLRVTEMAVSLAQAFGLTDQEILHLRRGALLHDIGKMGVPDHILLKPGKLTDEEWEIMSKHPQFAYEMLRSIAYLRPSIDIPYLHHEKWDGTGYPQGLKSDQIPLAARIFAIVDVYDALTSDRPYRKAWTKADTLQYLREQSGSHFDPQVVEKFIEVFGRTKS